ncbi:MAG: xanthine dehydrogenase family protein molybdopterin-binding subunit [Gammaproteobacteria bacterium]|nr:xanthine dehydrogenase family protein molybdopterin-binding subunit [Gammaproteobacteria bacterium]
MSGIVNLSLSRRRLLAGVSAGAGVLVLGLSLPVRPARAGSASPATVNAFVAIAADGTVTVQSPFVEMGQAVYTSIPMLVAEELDVPMSAMRCVQAPHGPAYKIMFGNSVRFTGGSLSVRSSWDPLRRAGATARAMLVQAAAQGWNVPASECTTDRGDVVHAPSGRRRGYGELAAVAAQLSTPAEVTLKDPRDFRLIGQPVRRLDSAEKVDGSAVFGIDVRAADMLYAAVRQSAVVGGAIKSFAADAVLGLPGVIAVEPIPNGVAVLADGHWRARQALEQLPVEIDGPDGETFDSEAWLARMRARLDDPGKVAEMRGADAAAVVAAAERVVRADYDAPLLAHATLEPMNCTALVRERRCTVWAPNQGADFVAEIAAQITGLPIESIEVLTPFLGGGFGRRSTLDYVVQAVTLANRYRGRPVQVLWSREEDIRRDHFRPLGTARLRAALDGDGMPAAIHITAVGDGPMRRHFAMFMEDPALDESVIEGLVGQPYAIPAARVDYVYEPLPVQIGFWRSVGNSLNAFFKECFIDELAHAARRDPVEYRRALLGAAPRFRRVLDQAVQMSGWRGQAWLHEDGSRRAHGVALHESFGSVVAEIAEIAIDADRVRVHKVWCAVDCGRVVNPAHVIMQMESGIAFGLSATLGERITIEGGRVGQSNFDDYPILTPAQMPAIEVAIIDSGAALGGAGEPGTPPIAAAVCNAVFALTGTRVRSLPLAGWKLGCKACAPQVA